MKLYSSTDFVNGKKHQRHVASELLDFAVRQCGLDSVTYIVEFSGDDAVPSVSASAFGSPAPFIRFGNEGNRITIERLDY
jgi:hypothetical protein